ncbi:hypothetical protein HYY69_03840 [Candidatus Woesearchaeota archaeon]|nr:hypothetical protein [Candidatus Woesearchaeota archaeon]
MDNKKTIIYSILSLLLVAILAIVYAGNPSVTVASPGTVAYFNASYGCAFLSNATAGGATIFGCHAGSGNISGVFLINVSVTDSEGISTSFDAVNYSIYNQTDTLIAINTSQGVLIGNSTFSSNNSNNTLVGKFISATGRWNGSYDLANLNGSVRNGTSITGFNSSGRRFLDGNYTLSFNISDATGVNCVTINGSCSGIGNVTLVVDTMPPNGSMSMTNLTNTSSLVSLVAAVTDIFTVANVSFVGSGVNSVNFNLSNRSLTTNASDSTRWPQISGSNSGGTTWNQTVNVSATLSAAAAVPTMIVVSLQANDTANNSMINRTEVHFMYDNVAPVMGYNVTRSDNQTTMNNTNWLGGTGSLSGAMIKNGSFTLAFNVTANDTQGTNANGNGLNGSVVSVTFNITRNNAVLTTLTAVHHAAVTAANESPCGGTAGGNTGTGSCRQFWSATYPINSSAWADGVWNMTAVATDSAGNIVTRDLSFTVDMDVDAAAAETTTVAAGSKGGDTPSSSAGTNLVTAGQSADAGEVTTSADSAALYRVGAGGTVNFNVNGEAHALKVDSISGGLVTVTVSSEPQTLEVNKGETKQVDLDSNGVDDVAVTVEKIISAKAYIKIWKLSDTMPVAGPATTPSETPSEPETEAPSEVPSEAPGAEAEEQPVQEPSGSNVWWWVLLALVVVVGVVWYAKSKKN